MVIGTPTQGRRPSTDALKYHGQMTRAKEAACFVMLSSAARVFFSENQLTATRLAWGKSLLA